MGRWFQVHLDMFEAFGSHQRCAAFRSFAATEKCQEKQSFSHVVHSH